MQEQNLDNQISISEINTLSNINKEDIINPTIDELHIESLKRRINGIIQYQKPYILKVFFELQITSN